MYLLLCRKGVVHYNAIMSLRTALDKLEQMKGLKSEEKGINMLLDSKIVFVIYLYNDIMHKAIFHWKFNTVL